MTPKCPKRAHGQGMTLWDKLFKLKLLPTQKSADYTPIHCASWNRVCGEARSVSSKPNRNKSQLPCSHFECWGRWEAGKNFRHCLYLWGSNRSNKSATCQIAVPPKRTPNRLRTAAQVYLTFPGIIVGPGPAPCSPHLIFHLMKGQISPETHCDHP